MESFPCCPPGFPQDAAPQPGGVRLELGEGCVADPALQGPERLFGSLSLGQFREIARSLVGHLANFLAIPGIARWLRLRQQQLPAADRQSPAVVSTCPFPNQAAVRHPGCCVIATGTCSTLLFDDLDHSAAAAQTLILDTT